MINPLIKIDEPATGAPLSTRLNKEERKLYEQHERAIRGNFKAFLDVGERLADIRDRRLYREEFATFESYCRTRWEMSDRRARQLIEGTEIVHELREEIEKSGTMVPIPTSENLVPTTERQTRELVKVPASERSAVMREATRDGAVKPSAGAIKEAAAKITKAGEPAKAIARGKNERQRIDEVFARVPKELHEKLRSLASQRNGSSGTALHHERAELALAVNPNATHNEVDALRSKPSRASAKVSGPVAPESVDRDECIQILCKAIHDLKPREEREAIEAALKSNAWKLFDGELAALAKLRGWILKKILPCMLHGKGTLELPF